MSVRGLVDVEQSVWNLYRYHHGPVSHNGGYPDENGFQNFGDGKAFRLAGGY
jgi:hypothetical protein